MFHCLVVQKTERTGLQIKFDASETACCRCNFERGWWLWLVVWRWRSYVCPCVESLMLLLLLLLLVLIWQR